MMENEIFHRQCLSENKSKKRRTKKSFEKNMAVEDKHISYRIYLVALLFFNGN
jgi:hypothetical protein